MTDEVLSRILYVEDDPDIRMIASFALEELGGFTLLACESGLEALGRVEAFRPQMVLLDVMMPGMDGPTTLGRLRALPVTAETPVVFMTAKVQPREVEGYRAMGAIGVISKPFGPVALPDEVRAMWERRHAG